MKSRFVFVVAFILGLSISQATLTVQDPNYAVGDSYDHGFQSIAAFNWDSAGTLTYQTANAYNFGGLYQVNAGTYSTVVAGNSDYAGASVTTVGDYIYYNRTYIYSYGPTGAASNHARSIASNYSLYGYNGKLFNSYAEGWPTSSGYLGFSTVNADGTLSAFTTFANVGGNSGAMVFDGAGNLYYAPGYNDKSVYKWSEAEVSLALSGGTALSSDAGHVWLDYSSDVTFSGVSGATALAMDQAGNLLVALTDYSNPSYLVSFDVNDSTGAYAGTDVILESNERINDMHEKDGTIYVATGSKISQVVPEPSAALLLVSAFGAFALARARRSRLA